MRIVSIAIFSALITSANAAGTTWEPIDLNQPGTLERLQTEKPEHFRAITEVLRVVERVPCGNAEVRSLEVRFDIRDMACHFALMTSDPPKRRLSFALEGTSYVAVVTLMDTRGKSVPLASTLTIAAEAPVMFRVTVKSDGRVIDQPSFLANVGQPATVSLSSGGAVEALAKPVEPDGRSWTQVRIIYSDTADAKFVQEMSLHHSPGQRMGSFDYTDPLNRRFTIEVGAR